MKQLSDDDTHARARRRHDAADAIRFLYFTPSDVLIPRVDRQCIMRFCEAVARTGTDVEVVSLDVELEFDEPTRSRDLFDVYGLATPFKVTVLPSRMRQSDDDDRGPRIWRAVAYTGYAFWKLLFRREAFKGKTSVLYFKNYLIGVSLLALKALLRGRLLLLFEIHVPPKGRLGSFVVRRCDGVIPVSRILGNELVEDFGINSNRILVAHMGVDLEFVEGVRQDKRQSRQLLDLPFDKKLVVYTGKVHSWSGEIDLFLRAAALLSPDTEMVLVGGREDHVQELRRRLDAEGIDNVRLVGFVAPADVFHYQMAADVLVTYYPSDIALNKYRASPGKLFEYMAVQRPIVTADYPALREVLGPDAAMFVEKDRPEELARGIDAVLADDALAARLAAQAYAGVQEFTWDKRSERVLDFVEHLQAHRAASPISEVSSR